MDGGVIISSQRPGQVFGREQTVKNGSQVSVKIISSNGNGKYIGNVAGVRVNISSNRILENGSVFKAKIFVQDGTVFLTPLENSSGVGISVENFPLSLIENQQIFSFLKNLGLPADSVMLDVLKMMKQQEMKMNMPLFKRIHNYAVKFGGKRKSAAEILMILAEKKLDADEDEILSLIDYLENQDGGEKKRDQSGEQKGEQSGEQKAKALLNEINCKNGRWFVFPFELERIGEESRVFGHGNIRLLFSKNERLQLMNVFCFCSEKKYYFSCVYDGGNCTKIKLYVETSSNSHDFSAGKFEEVLLNLQKRMDLLFKNGRIKKRISVEMAPKNEIEGFACESEAFYSVNQRI